MDFRTAKLTDLPQLKSVFKAIIENMNDNNVPIWDDIYPCEFFEEDIKNEQLYVLTENGVIVSAFALCSSNSGENAVKWHLPAKNSLYLDRFGVNVNYLRKGIGSLMLEKAKEAAKAKGADNLRLFVVDINKPAMRLYEKNGFVKADGVYDEIIDDDLTLREFGYEKSFDK
ncbi:MAG: GNAT family N-acetyltransferase [Oscillospiraceae bacterium]|nr:GNAT family N-acetyltransferase [Oscillospiraceae bacterium]